MPRFRKKPVIVDAAQFNGDIHEVELFALINSQSRPVFDEGHYLLIDTLEGTHRANIGDWIIKGVKGELYPCKPDIFKETYEEV